MEPAVRDALRVALSSGVDEALSAVLHPAEAGRLERFAGRLPTVGEGIVEIPLGPARAGAGPDFHLMPHAVDDRLRLAGVLRRMPEAAGADRDDAMAMADLIESWPTDAGLVCEYDVDTDAAVRLPSLFLNFPAAWTEVEHGAARDLLFGRLPDWQPCRAGIEALAAAAGAGSRVSWIGVMLPRRPRVLRVNLAFVRDERIGAILEGRLPPDRVGRACDALGWAAAAAERAVLAVDLSADGLGADVGLECFVDDRSGEDVDCWSGFLDAARRRGLISEAESVALCSWPGRTMPASRAVPPWPDAWIVADLFGDGRLPQCLREVNHLKVTAKASGRTTLKAYLRFLLDWTAVETGERPVQPQPPEGADFLAAVRHGDTVREAVRRAFSDPYPPRLADVAQCAGFTFDGSDYRSDWMARRLGSTD
jgi:hypothetical protein